ncbi:hypothetical protein CXB51_029312 [Gossypium anomalum]|uniref:Reverse transcriptase Ty1/copia-type domain-containing protein n=1 Tax=Gossypium anomalum TaxID=47600 RepID=A0A8J5YC84_9ROSI|nr:hypothetical protein CXB51_029312 [Gossypium anomalum]
METKDGLGASTSSMWTRPTIANARLAVEIFDGTSHFGMWQSEGLDIAIDEKKPDDVQEKDWKAINRLACGTIRSCLSREQRYAFSKETSANKLWVALEENFLKKNSQNKLHLKKRLFRFTYVPGTTMNDHITKFNQLVTDLLNMDETFKDEDLALMLLGSLPEEFEFLETTLLHGKSDISLSEVCVALYNACVAKHDTSDSELSLVESSSFHSDEWILDSGCTYHMSPNREWFSDLVELNGGVVYMGNDNACKTVGIGSIQLKNQDGSTRVLTDVRYVPSLKKNIISLGALESKGSIVTMRDGVLKVTSGALVILKGIRKNNLYYYQGSTVIGAVAAASDNKELDSMQLWHMKLGHASEKSLKILAKQGLLKNGVAERMNRTLLEKVRCMLSNAGLGKQFWAEAVTYAGHLVNRLPSSALERKTPMEESKLDPRAKKALFIGITSRVKGFRLWCLGTKKMICSRDVTFDESATLKKVANEDIQTGDTPQQVECTPKQVEFEQVRICPVNKSNSPATMEELEVEEVLTQEPLSTPEPVAVARPRREIRRPARFTDMVAYALPIVDDDIPVTYQEAMQSLESDKWKSAMDEEMQSLRKNNTWELAQLPKGKKAIGCKWHSSIRILLALVAQLNLDLAQLDVKTAFLHGELEEEIYMTQPKGYEDAGGRNWVCKLNKSLYGLKQSPREWYKRFDSFMRRQKYTRSKYDNCVYLQKLHDRSFIYLLLYVDDMLIALKSQKEIDKLKALLNEEFEMKDLGEAKKILGMEISRDRQRGKLCLNQKQYLKKVLQCFGVNENTKHVSTPLASHLKLNAQLSPKTEGEREYMAKVPYANAVGSLMYAIACTRPDTSQAVGVVSRYMHDPGKGHWQAVKWILRYLRKTEDAGLVFEQDEALGQFVVGYVDSDFAGDLDKRRSTTGYLFTLAKAPVSWKSTLQSTVAISTTEAEYMAVTKAVKDAIWLNGLLEDLGVVQSHISLYCDSQSAIHLAKNQVYHSRTKHIDVRYHFVREVFEKGKILLQKIPTADNPADMMTKVVTTIKFNHCLNLINILRI